MSTVCLKLQDQPLTFYGIYYLVLLASSEQGHALDRFSAACNHAGMKHTLKRKRPKYYVATNPRQCVIGAELKISTGVQNP